MPKNNAEKKDNQQNHDAFVEEEITINEKKASEYPANLNGINKNNQT
jgi:hypothetical protein